MEDGIKVTDNPDGGCVVEMDGEIIHYTKEEVDEMREEFETMEGQAHE